jgi:lysophospholipid acyltransferase (LPLAT)-like uncharacterized protein
VGNYFPIPFAKHGLVVDERPVKKEQREREAILKERQNMQHHAMAG